MMNLGILSQRTELQTQKFLSRKKLLSKYLCAEDFITCGCWESIRTKKLGCVAPSRSKCDTMNMTAEQSIEGFEGYGYPILSSSNGIAHGLF
jgi:hypothetical protein